MPTRHQTLPQARGQPLVTDGGIETTLIYQYHLDLPSFAAFTLLDSPEGMVALRSYYATYLDLARRLGLGLLLESPTWRANPDWGAQLGYSAHRLEDINRRAMALMHEIRDEAERSGQTVVIAGNLGPRGDGYVPSALMTNAQARDYHRPQIRTFAEAGADLISVLTMNYTEEAIGIALASRECGLPVAISFTVETDGRLPTGETLQQAIEATDAATDGYPAYYMVNCAHPSHLHLRSLPEGPWRGRVRGIRANASEKSHAELNELTTLDAGDPVAFGDWHRDVGRSFPQLCVIGGCCGTDQRHVEAAWRAFRQPAR